jgi:hypothetical protein
MESKRQPENVRNQNQCPPPIVAPVSAVYKTPFSIADACEVWDASKVSKNQFKTQAPHLGMRCSRISSCCSLSAHPWSCSRCTLDGQAQGATYHYNNTHRDLRFWNREHPAVSGMIQRGFARVPLLCLDVAAWMQPRPWLNHSANTPACTLETYDSKLKRCRRTGCINSPRAAARQRETIRRSKELANGPSTGQRGE